MLCTIQNACVCQYVCVCVCVHVCTVSKDKILCFLNTFIIIIYYCIFNNDICVCTVGIQTFEPGMDVMEVDENDFYHHSGSGQPNSSESNSEDEEHQENSYDSYSIDPAHSQYYGYAGHLDLEGGAHSRFIQTQNSEEEDAKEQETEAVDPGSFRYNKRVFVTALPCLLLTLIMTGETWVITVNVCL